MRYFDELLQNKFTYFIKSLNTKFLNENDKSTNFYEINLIIL